MNVLLVGSGGREQAIAWKLRQSPCLKRLISVPAVAADFSAREHAIDIAVIGSEAPLAAGVSDALRRQGVRVFGPSQAAARIESSKLFAKQFMDRHGIPTARYACFTSYAEACLHIAQIHYPFVIKASGLAAGKGVFLPDTQAEAAAILRQLLCEHMLGAAGAEIVIEERLEGPEVSLLCFTDGRTLQLMPPARDYKRLLAGDKGPNTGGMGAYAPVELPVSVSLEQLKQTILQPTIDGLRNEGMPFVGVLYAGLMLTAQGPRVLEFNCRLGDPETQVLLPLLTTDLLDIIEACTTQQLQTCPVQFSTQSAVCVVLASADYPQKGSDGESIQGVTQQADNSCVFEAATRQQGEAIVTAGGRVLGVTAWGETLPIARERAYERVQGIQFKGMQYRNDIAASQVDLYAQAGVDIHAGNKAVQLMSAAVKSTYGKEVLAGIGAFGGMFDATRVKAMPHPVLVASTDGIGTKVEVALKAGQIEGLGHDMVNHSINDILVQGAKPLFFLDYVASSRLDPAKIATLVTGMAEACRAAGCALLGGETAEMPGVYAPGMVDVAGTIVGLVEREDALPRPTLQAGDVLLGLTSSGPHTNGYSLIRRIFADTPLDTLVPQSNSTLAQALLKPHRSYLPVLEPVLSHPDKLVKALVHITGGGFWENIPRVLPPSLSAQMHKSSWPIPPLFQFIQHKGDVTDVEMLRVFNMGIGMIVIVDKAHVDLVSSLMNETCYAIGQLVSGDRQVHFE